MDKARKLILKKIVARASEAHKEVILVSDESSNKMMSGTVGVSLSSARLLSTLRGMVFSLFGDIDYDFLIDNELSNKTRARISKFIYMGDRHGTN